MKTKICLIAAGIALSTATTAQAEEGIQTLIPTDTSDIEEEPKTINSIIDEMIIRRSDLDIFDKGTGKGK